MGPWASASSRSLIDVLDAFGTPSYRSKAQVPSVVSYAVDGHEEWITFDFSRGQDVTLEDTYRVFLIASLLGDRDEIEPLLVTAANQEILWASEYPHDVAALLAEQYRTM